MTWSMLEPTSSCHSVGLPILGHPVVDEAGDEAAAGELLAVVADRLVVVEAVADRLVAVEAVADRLVAVAEVALQGEGGAVLEEGDEDVSEYSLWKYPSFNPTNPNPTQKPFCVTEMVKFYA
jgi:hypothetical protein